MRTTTVERARGTAATEPAARRRVDPAHVALIAVSAAYCLIVLLRTPQSVTLTFDEVVYASQLSADSPAAEFYVQRARGLPLLLAPVVMVTEWVVALRVYLAVVSGAFLYLAFLPWLAVFRRAGGAGDASGAGGRLRYVPAVAAGFFATLWMAQLFANLAYPNLWLGFMIVAGVGWFCRAVTEPPPAWGPVLGVVAAFAVASLIRPSDATAAAGPLVLAALLVPRWRRFWPAAAVVAGLSVGWLAWAGEAFARFGGPMQRLRMTAEGTGSGLVNSLPENLHTVNGPSLLCRPASNCAGIEPLVAAWWVLLPVLVVAGLAVAARTGWFGPGVLATGSAVTFAVPYLFLLDYTSPRFLLAGYALLAIPVAGLLVWLVGLGNRLSRALLTLLVLAALVPHVIGQQETLSTVSGRMEHTYGQYEKLADFLREEQGVRPPCLVWGAGAVQLGYQLKCQSDWEPGGDAPGQDNPVIAAAVARGDTVVVRTRAGEEPPPFMDGWRRVEEPGRDTYVSYLAPAEPSPTG